MEMGMVSDKTWKNPGVISLQSIARQEQEKLAIRPFEQEDVTAHGHDCFELVYVTGGTAVQNINGTIGTVSKGDYYIIDRGSVHAYQESKHFTLINCLFLPEIIDATMAGCSSFEELLRVCLVRYYKQRLEKGTVDRIFHDEDGRILELLKGMQNEYEEQSIGCQEIFRCRLLEILILTMRKVVGCEADVRNRQSEKSQMILEAVRFLEEHFPEKTVLGHFCESYHYSQQYISRKFKQETGFTALEYLQKLRIEKGCELLAGSDLRITEIAQRIGYEDVKFFHTVFKRMVGVSPREYRKMMKKPV